MPKAGLVGFDRSWATYWERAPPPVPVPTPHFGTSEAVRAVVNKPLPLTLGSFVTDRMSAGVSTIAAMAFNGGCPSAADATWAAASTHRTPPMRYATARRRLLLSPSTIATIFA